jgi:alpha-tubulin suppressor-like RCC1 family protein
MSVGCPDPRWSGRCVRRQGASAQRTIGHVSLILEGIPVERTYRLGLLVLAGAGLSLAPMHPAAAAGPAIEEWGVTSSGWGSVPTLAQIVAGAVTIDAGNRSDLVVKSDGTVWGWGRTEVAAVSQTLVQIPGLVNVVQRPVDGNHDFAALETPGGNPACPDSSTLWTWGLDQAGDLGLGFYTARVVATPEDVTTLDCKDVVEVVAAASHMLALTASGQIYVWGGNGDDVFANTTKKADLPTLDPVISALTGASAVGVEITTGSSMAGILVDGQAYDWGNNLQDECGCGSTAAVVTAPTEVLQNGVQYTVIDEGGNTGKNGHTLALDAAGNVYAWGDGAQGQLGQGTTANSNAAVAVTGLPAIADVRAGGMQSLALDAAGNVWAWGDSNFGQVGTGSNTVVLLPTEVLSGVSMISAGSLHSLAA